MIYTNELKREQLELLASKIIINTDIIRSECHCDICHTISAKHYENLKLLSENEPRNLISTVYDKGWRVVNNICYCKRCHEQLVSLMELSKNNLRPSKVHYYLNIAKEVSSRSTCLRKKYGAVLIKNDVIIATGYNGSPRGTANCIDLQNCRREKLNIPRGQCYEMCRSVHAEQNCIINASRNDMIDSDLYLFGLDVKSNEIVENLDSCQLCKKMIINSGIKRVIFARPNNNYEIKDVSEWVANDETLTDKFGY